MSKSDLCFHLLTITVTLCFFSLLEPYQLGFTPDSLSYLEVATNIKDGNGITNYNGQLVNHWPPLFSVLVAMTSKLLPLKVIQAGVVVQVILYYFLVFVFMLVLRQLKINKNLILISGLLLAISPVSSNFLNFLSEGLFLVLLFLNILFFLKWMDKSNSLNLIYSAIFCGLFLLTRYAGIAFAGGLLIFMLFFQKGRFNTRVKAVIIYLIVTGLVISPWLIYQSTFDAQNGGRRLAIHIIKLSKFLDLFKTIISWFLGSVFSIFLFFTLTIVFLFKLYKAQITNTDYIKKFFEKYRNILLFLLVLIFIYPMFLIVSISFYDSWTPLDNRILSPIFPLILIIIILLLQFLNEIGQKLISNSIILFLLLNFCFSIYPTFNSHYYNGRGYTKKVWVESETIKFLNNEKIEIPTFSNGIEIGELHLQKRFQLLPRPWENLDIQKLRKKVDNCEAQIVYFENVNWRNYLISKDDLLNLFEPENFICLDDGFIIRKSTFE